MPNIKLTVFTKPWTEPIEALADKVVALGLDGIELPVRPGYQVEPAVVAKGLPFASRILAERGLTIGSVAGPLDEATIAACGEAGVPIIRTMVFVDPKKGFAATMDDYRRQFDALIPSLERHGVAIGVQNHYGNFIGSAAGILHVIQAYDPKLVCAVLDMAHCSVAGEPLELALDIVWNRLKGLVNFKSAFQMVTTGPEEAEAKYHIHWTTARYAAYSWRELVDQLRARGFSGTFCLPAEYSDPAGKPQRMGDDVLPFLREDISYLKSLLAKE